MRKWYSLIDKVYKLDQLRDSFQQVRSNKGSRSVGIDKVTAKAYAQDLEENLCQLSEELRTGTYKPCAVRRVYIDKPDGSKRSLGIPTIKDRVVQQALLNVLQPIFDPDFHPSSYGYRPKRSAGHAIAKADFFSRQRNLSYVVDMDLSKFFDTLDHKLLLQFVNRKVSDGKILRLINQLLKSGVMDGKEYHVTEKGSPQGGIISPLLANIYLNEFDQEMRNQDIRIVRYADDILIFARTKTEAGKYRAYATDYLENKLKLCVNQTKTRLTDLWSGIEYLGFTLTAYGVSISAKSINKFKEKVRALTPRNSGKKFSERIRKLNELLRGYSNYFRIARSGDHFKISMGWIRRRLRSMKMKAWKSWKPLHKQLRRMGYKGNFEKISVTRWRNSCCKLIHWALPDKWFEEQGLFNMGKVCVDTLHQYYE